MEEKKELLERKEEGVRKSEKKMEIDIYIDDPQENEARIYVNNIPIPVDSVLTVEIPPIDLGEGYSMEYYVSFSDLFRRYANHVRINEAHFTFTFTYDSVSLHARFYYYWDGYYLHWEPSFEVSLSKVFDDGGNDNIFAALGMIIERVRTSYYYQF